MAKKAASIYVVLVLFLVIYNQVRCAPSEFSTPKNAPKHLAGIDLRGEKLPAGWKQEAKPAAMERAQLLKNSESLLVMHVGAQAAAKKLARLKTRDSSNVMDKDLQALENLGAESFAQSFPKPKRSTRVGVYSSHRGSYSSSSYGSGSYSSHK